MNMIQIQLKAIGVWTPAQGRKALDNKIRREVAGKFWNQVFQWSEMATWQQKVEHINYLLKQVEYTPFNPYSGVPERLVFNKDFYFKRKAMVFRFYRAIQDRLELIRNRTKITTHYWVVQDPNGVKGFWWGLAVPKSEYVIFGKQEENSAHTPNDPEEETPNDPEPAEEEDSAEQEYSDPPC